jgi:PAS domain S-box-containing protein
LSPHQSTPSDDRQGQETSPSDQYRDEQFRLWLENIADIITVFKADGTIFYQSASITHLLGWDAEDRIGQNIFINPITHPDDISIQKAFLLDTIHTNDKTVTSTFRLQRKDGSYCFVEAIGRNMLHHPLVKGVIATYRDITERMEIEQRKEEFIRVASHELRTPITSLKGHTQVLKMMLAGHDLDEPIEYLSIIENQIDRLTRLINDLLDVTKINVGSLDYKDTLFAVDPFVHNIVTLLQHTNPHHTLRLSGQSHAQLFADRDRLAQVLINLVNNAIKYSPPELPINITIATQDDQVIIQVHDNGKGIPPCYHQRIFERFYRVPNQDNATLSGLGIGLYLCKEIIARHHGEIEVESATGQGTTFSISLPISKIAPTGF